MSVNKVVYDGNTLIDLTGDTLTSADQLAEGVVAHTASGETIVGTGLTPVTMTYTGAGTTKYRTIDTGTTSNVCVITNGDGLISALVTATGMFYASNSTEVTYKTSSVANFRDGVLHMATAQYINASGYQYIIQVL